MESLDRKTILVLINELLTLVLPYVEGVVREVLLRIVSLVGKLNPSEEEDPCDPYDYEPKEFFFAIRFGESMEYNKISLIKILRQHTSLGLKEAKDMVEYALNHRGMWSECELFGSNKISNDQTLDLYNDLRESFEELNAQVKVYKFFGM